MWLYSNQEQILQILRMLFKIQEMVLFVFLLRFMYNIYIYIV